MTGVREGKLQSKADTAQFDAAKDVFENASGAFPDKLDAFPKFASRQAIAKFLTKYELFKKLLRVNGSIVECGVLHGGGLLAWAKLSAILEPVNHTRKVIGFDTFGGFPSIHDKDRSVDESGHLKVGGLTGSTLDEVMAATSLFDLNRPLNHIPKIELVPGDMTKTAQRYIADNPHLVVSLLYLDVDLYEPTKAALEAFVPRMPKGAIVVFDQLNAATFPGETLAVHEYFGIHSINIERFSFDSYVSYAVLG